MFNKKHPVHPEEFLVTFNSGFKLRSYAAATRMCRKTVLGPTFGCFINALQKISEKEENKCIFGFSTEEKLIGLIKIPADGNPYNTMAVVAHPGSVSNITALKSQKYMLSAGGADGAVHMWLVNDLVFESQAALYENCMEPFLNILDPSGQLAQSPIYREFEDYFYYAQLQIQGEGRQESRLVSDKVPLDKIPSIMQAMGYYPSNQEIDDLINEVKCNFILIADSRFAQGEGEEVDSITFHDLIKLFINHRPYGDVNLEDIELSLSHARRLETGRPTPTGPVKKINPDSLVKTQGIISLLQQYGIK